jgi:signal transduction histidine kinase
VTISIEDEGVPLSGTSANRAFEPFFTTKVSGTGLGLAIVRRAAELHRGTVTMQARDGGGTVVTLTLPVRWFEADE